MASKAVTPSKAAPYPVLIGTATTGAAVIPPTRLARAPSIPATTTTASVSASSSAEASSRCTPATPQSARRVGGSPRAVRVAAHSRATGRSDVPAVTTRVRAARRGAGRQTTVEISPRTWSRAGGPAGRRASAPRVLGHDERHLVGIGPGEDNRSPGRIGVATGIPSSSSPTIDEHCSGVLPCPYTASGRSLAQGTVVVDLGEPEVGEGEAPEPEHRVVGRALARTHLGQQALQRELVHDVHYPAWVWPPTHLRARSAATALRIGFLGPEGTFTEEALFSEPDYAVADITPMGSLAEVLEAVRTGSRTWASSPWRTPSRAPSGTSSTVWSSTSTCGSSGRWSWTSTCT